MCHVTAADSRRKLLPLRHWYQLSFVLRHYVNCEVARGEVAALVDFSVFRLYNYPAVLTSDIGYQQQQQKAERQQKHRQFNTQ